MAGTNRYKEMAKSILAVADVNVDGSNPWDIQVHNEDFYQRVFSQGTLGLGEAYMDGWWDCKRLDEFFDRVLRARLDVHLQKNWKLISGILIKIAKANHALETRPIPVESVENLRHAAINKKKKTLNHIISETGDIENLLYLGLSRHLADKLLGMRNFRG